MSRRRCPSRGASAPALVAVRSILIAFALSTAAGLGPFLSASRAQQLTTEPAAGDSVDSDSVDSPPGDEDEQTLIDPASLGQDDAKESPAAESDPAPEEAVPPLEPAPKRNLLEEKLADGEGEEPGQVPFDGEEGSFILVTTKPHHTRLQAKNELDRLMLEAADERYIAAVHSPRATFWYPLDLAYVRSELLLPDGELYRRDHDGMYVGHALIGFDEPFERRLRAVRVASRSMQIVAAGGTAIALLIVAFAFLRLDRATRGLYTGRLQTWAVVACAVVACITGFVAYWIPWI